jgi:acyl-CoA thioester hydrolase
VSYRHEVRVRYGECDMQRVVYNPHYMAYVDDATDTWFRETLPGFGDISFDTMLKRFEIEWSSPARVGELLVLELAVVRWGTTSFDVGVTGHVGDRLVFEATVMFVATTPGEARKIPVSDDVKALLGGPVPP